MTEEEKQKRRYSLVVKSNEMIRKNRYSLSLTEQRIILYLISRIKPTDTELFEYEFDIKDFCEVCGIDYINNLTQLKETIKALRDKSFWLKLPNGVETTCGWINKATLIENSGIGKIELDKDLVPYLLQLRDNFTKYELIATLALKSKFSIRIYELLKSYEFVGTYQAAIADLRKILMVENEYPKNNDFRRFIIDKSIDEINTFTDLEIDYEIVKTGRAITGFIFTIKKAENWDGQYHAATLFLKGRLPSKGKQNKDFQEFKEQMKLWD